MEAVMFNGVVSDDSPDKIQENFSLPAEVRDVIGPLIDRHGRKRKWMFYVAALLNFLEQGEIEMAERIAAVAGTEHTGRLKNLLAEARERGLDNDIGGVTDEDVQDETDSSRKESQSREGRNGASDPDKSAGGRSRGSAGGRNASRGTRRVK